MGLRSEIKEALRPAPVIVNIKDSVRRTIEQMAEGNASAAIVKDGDQVAGVVTDMDILDSFKRGENFDRTETLAIMSSCDLIAGKAAKFPCIQLDSSQSVQNGLALMHGAGIHHVVVTSEKDALVGVLSLVDLLKLAIA